MGLRGFHAGQRGRNVLQAGRWSLVAKCAAAANLFVSVPFVLNALGTQQFGAWATLVALVTFSNFLDFGIGNGAMNLVAAAHGRGASHEIATIWREARLSLAKVSAWTGLAGGGALVMVPWERMLGLPASLATESRNAVAAVLVAVVLAIPLNLANRVQLGLGRGDVAFRWQAIGQVCTLGLVVALAWLRAPLATLTAAAVATPLVAAIANTAAVARRPEIRDGAEPVYAERIRIRQGIEKEGMMFFGLQLTAALSFSLDLPLISTIRGATDAGNYAIVQRLFSLIPLSLSLIWAPLWPTYRQALAAGDRGWVARTLRRSLIAATVFAAASGTGIAMAFDQIAAVWVPGQPTVATTLLAGFVVWCVVEAAGTALATFLNAASVLRYQLATAVAFAILCLGFKFWIVARGEIALLPWVTAATYFVAAVLPFLWFGPRILKNAFSRNY